MWQVLHDVGQALRHVHAMGLVHLDVKPANLLIGDEGTQITNVSDLPTAVPSRLAVSFVFSPCLSLSLTPLRDFSFQYSPPFLFVRVGRCVGNNTFPSVSFERVRARTVTVQMHFWLEEWFRH